jgi:hypothetical protein
MSRCLVRMWRNKQSWRMNARPHSSHERGGSCKQPHRKNVGWQTTNQHWTVENVMYSGLDFHKYIGIGRNVSVLHWMLASSGTHALCTMGKVVGREADNSIPSIFVWVHWSEHVLGLMFAPVPLCGFEKKNIYICLSYWGM